MLKPLLINMAIAVPLSLALGGVLGFVHSDNLALVVVAFGWMGLYFVDYFSNGLTASLIYQQVTTGGAKMDQAMQQTKKISAGHHRVCGHFGDF